MSRRYLLHVNTSRLTSVRGDTTDHPYSVNSTRCVRSGTMKPLSLVRSGFRLASCVLAFVKT
eukprot:5539264-Prymnesium_polylepis.1